MKNLFKATFKIFLGIFMTTLVSMPAMADLNRSNCIYNDEDISSSDWNENWQTLSASLPNGNSYYRYDAYFTAGYIYYISLCDDDGGSANFDTYLGLSTEDWDCYEDLDNDEKSAVITNDDYCGTRSRIEYECHQSRWGSIYVSGWSSNYGTFTIAYKYSTPHPIPDNSVCASAIALNCNETLNGTTVGTTGIVHGLPSSASLSNYGVWYTFVGNGERTTVTVNATNYDSEVAIVGGSCGNYTWIGSHDGGGSSSSTDTYTFIATSGTTYYAYVAYYYANGTSSDVGNFTIRLECEEAQRYTVNYDGNGGYGNIIDPNSPYIEGSSVTTLLNSFVRDGYEFIRWNTSADGGGTNYIENYTFSINNNVTLYAQWRKIPNVNTDNCVPTGNNEDWWGYLPSYSLYNYSLTQQIYTADEIGSSDIINSISFYQDDRHILDIPRSYKIYLSHTTKSVFENNRDWTDMSDATLVFEGTIQPYPYTWLDIELDRPFEYNGIDNLVITIDDNTGSWESTVYYSTYNTSDYQSIYIYSDGTNYDPINPSQYTGTLFNYKNQIKLCNLDGFTLPINLLEFSSEPKYNPQTGVHLFNLLTIRTGGEWNNCQFIVYRSSDAINWDYDNPVCDWDFGGDTIYHPGNWGHDPSLNPNYSDTCEMTYYPIDYEPYPVTYYKLIQRDCDNTTTEYTSEIIVCIANQQKHLIEPYILCDNGPQVVGGSEVCEVFVQNVLGQVVEEFQLQPYQQREVFAKIQGMYLITFVYKYNGEARKKTEKIICM